MLSNPQADRSKGPGEQHDRFLSAGVVDEDAEGVTIRGGKMLATGGVFANEVFVTCIQPLREGEEPYATWWKTPDDQQIPCWPKADDIAIVVTGGQTNAFSMMIAETSPPIPPVSRSS